MTPNDADKLLSTALTTYKQRTGYTLQPCPAVLFDMDGVLYDSMPGHARAWTKMCKDHGIDCTPEEFFEYEGRTGAATIDLLIQRQFGRPADDYERTYLYQVKSRYFKELGEPPLMPGAARAVATAMAMSKCVLVTGSGQKSILERLERDYPDAFPSERRVTAFDVKHGKPDPEPYLIGMTKAGVEAWNAVAVDNAPAGVISAVASKAFTIGVTTGPLPEGALQKAGADIVVNSMDDCADILEAIKRL